MEAVEALETHERRQDESGLEPEDSLSAGRGVSGSPIETTENGRTRKAGLQVFSPALQVGTVLIRATGVVAVRSRVPLMDPRRTSALHDEATENAHLQAFVEAL